MPSKEKSLEDFASELSAKRVLGYADTLPKDVQDQILASKASARVVVKWLHSLGYEDATYSKIDHWRRQERNARQGEP
jgi:hypothetical protein